MDIWRHKRTGKWYNVSDLHALMKDPQSGDWEQAVMYRQINQEPPQLYCRERNDFSNKFEKV